jgi:DNA-binding IscR family transcriptional regulator
LRPRWRDFVASNSARICPDRRYQDGHEVATSEQIATSANTKPVVIGLLLGELRRAGLVESWRGVGAGWSLARELESIIRLNVYEVVEPGPSFAMHRTAPYQGCVVGYGIQPAMQDIYEGIEKTLRCGLARVTLNDVLRLARGGSTGSRCSPGGRRRGPGCSRGAAGLR